MILLSLPTVAEKSHSEPVNTDVPEVEHSDITPITKYVQVDELEDMSDIFDEWEF